MPEEQLKVKEAIETFRKAKYTQEKIIDILCSIIQTQMMYGGSLEDKLRYEKFKAESDALKNTNHDTTHIS